MFDRYDVFSAPMPTFNIKGNQKKGSPLGCFLTTIAVVILVGSVAMRLLTDEGRTST